MSNDDNVGYKSAYQKAQIKGGSNSRKRYWDNKRLSFNYKGRKCVKCGFNEDNLHCYDFHHIDSKDKKYQLTSMFHSFKFHRLKNELDKTILVCGRCHRKIHYLDGYKEVSLYNDLYKYESYKNLPVKSKEYRALYNKHFSEKNRISCFNYMGSRCCECGFNEEIIPCYNYFCINLSLKKKNISGLMCQKNFEFLKNELSNYLLTCVNCHRKRDNERQE